jgi:hypothetical protein
MRSSSVPPVEGTTGRVTVVTPFKDTLIDDESRLRVRLDEVRRLGRLRRLRIQVPLTCAGVLIAFAGVATGVSRSWLALGGFGGAFGPWVILLGVLPTQSHIIGISLASMMAIFGFAMFASALSVFVSPCVSSAELCTVLLVANLYAIVVLGIGVLVAAAIGLALANNTLRVPWLPSRPPRAALLWTWHLAGALLLSYSLAWLAFGTVGLLRRLSEEERRISASANVKSPPPYDWLVDLSVGTELMILGSLSLWPRLRTTVQAWLARMDDGIAAAAAIASLLGSQNTDTMVALARATLRCVRADQLHPKLFDINEPAVSAFALSLPANLGGIDAFVSHSWSDPPDEKVRACPPHAASVLRACTHACALARTLHARAPLLSLSQMKLLQAWRAQFIRTRGREPTLWIDKCARGQEPAAQPWRDLIARAAHAARALTERVPDARAPRSRPAVRPPCAGAASTRPTSSHCSRSCRSTSLAARRSSRCAVPRISRDWCVPASREDCAHVRIAMRSRRARPRRIHTRRHGELSTARLERFNTTRRACLRLADACTRPPAVPRARVRANSHARARSRASTVVRDRALRLPRDERRRGALPDPRF